VGSNPASPTTTPLGVAPMCLRCSVQAMCGRFTSTTPASDLAAHFGAELLGHEQLVDPRWNVAPTTAVWVVHDLGGRRVLNRMRWGLVPPWADDPAVGSRMINARAETVADKPAYRRAFKARRCVLPADGFFEWGVVPGQRRKQPWYFSDPEKRPLSLAGLHETWRPRDGEPGSPDELHTCTVITTAADGIVGPVHARMPAVLDGEVLEAWLDPGIDDPEELLALLGQVWRDGLAAWPVGLAVNNVANDGPSLIDELTAV
jgi:putative SOS response-associated peptidase YedK